VVRLVRRPAVSAADLRWDPTQAGGGLEPAALDGLDAVVHLSGAAVAGGRWTAARKQELRASRIGSTTALIRAMLACSTPPPVLLAASAIGWYGDTGDREVDETAPHGSGILAEVVRDCANGPLAGVPAETVLPEPPAQPAAITATAPRATNRTADTTPRCHASCSAEVQNRQLCAPPAAQRHETRQRPIRRFGFVLLVGARRAM